MATIKDIADKLGIAVSTVSKGLNGATDISDSTRQMVLDAAVELGYSVKKIKMNRKNKLCILVKNMNYESTDNFGYEIITGFQISACRRNWEVSIIPYDKDTLGNRKFDAFMLENSFSGALLLGLTPDDPYMLQIKTSTIPAVLLDNFIPGSNTGYIGADSFEGISMVIDELIKLGHKNIAMLNGDKGSMVTDERCSAFISAVESHGLTVNTSLIKYGDYTADCVAKYIPEIIAGGATAIVCGSDIIAVGVLNQLSHMGLRVPDDISVTGYDNLPIAQYTIPPLTTVHQDRMALGKVAFSLLDNLIQGIPVSKILLRPRLVVRGSIGICPSKHR